jgi:hypothetical protein
MLEDDFLMTRSTHDAFAVRHRGGGDSKKGQPLRSPFWEWAELRDMSIDGSDTLLESVLARSQHDEN